MKINVVSPVSEAPDTTLLVLPIAEGDGELSASVAAIDGALAGQIQALRTRGDFRGKTGETLVLYAAAPANGRIVVAGLGAAPVTAESLRLLGGTVARQAARLRTPAATVILPEAEALTDAEVGRAVVEGAVLGAYTFTEMKSAPAEGPEPVHLESLTLATSREHEAVGEGARIGEVVARAETVARTLGNLPGNVATPSYLAERAEQIAAERRMTCTVLGPAELEAEGMGALLAVARGTEQEPRLIILEHCGGAADARPLVLMGKGLTFDAGGISIKPAAGMEEMKFDMCGGAAVIAAMQAIAELELPVRVVGIVPSSENLLGAAAMKPGDIIRSHLGKTIEVVNTDAEGRLILADALSYVRRYEPAAVVDAATLTGACVVALGHHASGIMGNDEGLLEEIRSAGERTGERCWPLPMYEEYREQIKSDYADIKNTGGRPAGTITAGWFLREFVEYPWVHIDVAGTAYGDGKLSYHSKGSTGAPTRLFVEWVRARAT